MSPEVSKCETQDWLKKNIESNKPRGRSITAKAKTETQIIAKILKSSFAISVFSAFLRMELSNISAPNAAIMMPSQYGK